MDDRKRRIGGLEQHKKEQAVLLDTLLTCLGEAIFSRLAGSSHEDDSVFTDLSSYRGFQDDIRSSEASIRAAEEQIQRFIELDKSIDAREREESSCLKELAGMHGMLGKLLLDAAADSIQVDYIDFCAPYRDQAEALRTKVDSLEDRIAGLEQRDSGNVFAWIGINAQSLVLRSFLTKAQENLERLRRTVGERYSRSDPGLLLSSETQDEPPVESVDIRELCAGIKIKLEESLVITQDLLQFKEERRRITGSFSADGGPQKYIQNLKNHITGIHDEMKALYRRIGSEAVSDDTAGNEKQIKRRLFINSLIAPEDKEIVDKAARIREAVRDDDAEIERLRASLAIDDERAKIEKYRKMIRDRQDKIEQAEKSISVFEGNIRESEEIIEKIQNQL